MFAGSCMTYTLFDVPCWFLCINWMFVLACSMWPRTVLWARQVCINHNGLWQGMERMILLARHWHTTLIQKPMGHDVYSMSLLFYGSDTHGDFVLPVGFCRVSTIQKSQAHSDDGVAHAEGEVIGRISCDYMVTLGSRSDGDIDILSLYVPGKHPESNNILSAYSLICICNLGVARHWL